MEKEQIFFAQGCTVTEQEATGTSCPGEMLSGYTKKLCTLWSIKHWSRLPRTLVKSPSLKILKTYLDRVLNSLLYGPDSLLRFGPAIPEVSSKPRLFSCFWALSSNRSSTCKVKKILSKTTIFVSLWNPDLHQFMHVFTLKRINYSLVHTVNNEKSTEA